MLESLRTKDLLIELHRAIEESSTIAAKGLTAGNSSHALQMNYPPNCGLTLDEAAAVASIPRSPVLESGLRKVIADAASYPLFHLLSLLDRVVELPKWTEIEGGLPDKMLHDEFYETYWQWRRIRPDVGWKLDVLNDSV